MQSTATKTKEADTATKRARADACSERVSTHDKYAAGEAAPCVRACERAPLTYPSSTTTNLLLFVLDGAEARWTTWMSSPQEPKPIELFDFAARQLCSVNTASPTMRRPSRIYLYVAWEGVYRRTI